MGPVTFRLGARTVAPFSVAPWAEEKLPADMPVLLKALRGDFFCAPFGGNGVPWRGEKHPPHGETANGTWRLKAFEAAAGRVTLHARLELGVRPGVADKFLTLIEGHTAVYQRHVLAAHGPISVGHHAMLKFPEAEGSGVVTTSRFVRAQVLPELFERPENYGYSALKTAAEFKGLDRVPLAHGGETDVSRYPARKGFDDLVMLTADPKLQLAWTTVTFPAERYVYFALRDPRVLRHTILWLSNGGRHYAPWNGRHTGVMGIEDTTSYFHFGLAESAAANPLNRKGIPTAVTLHPKRPLDVRYIVGVAEVPRGFDRVKELRVSAGAKGAAEVIELVAASGKRVRVAVETDFLRSDVD